MPRDISFAPRAATTLPAPATLIEAAYRDIRRDIVLGVHAAGEKLRVEHLKTRYAVSSGTLREALALLVSDSLVVSQGQRGFSVTPMSVDDLEDLSYVRSLVETEAARQSLARGNDEWEARLVSCFHCLSLAEERLGARTPEAYEEWERRNFEFHEALVSACASTRLLSLRSTLHLQAERYRKLSALEGPRPRDVHNEHQQIIDFALARDADKLVDVLQRHIRRPVDVILKSKLLADRHAATGEAA
ncbi:MAG: transcriptional regulator [Betaproteobacteria bacterium HGW-Betaproteobacteria-19]|nr:MAG: transcriptional regulator [Betaproteobacteria bacterium HGW-Betaproteobacteria-19]